MTTSHYLHRNSVTLWTEPGHDAPDEVKGTTRYFHPERLEWTVSLGRVYVAAHGTATRAAGQGVQGWTVTGHFADPLPGWIHPPWGVINHATEALLAIANELKTAGIEEGRVTEP